MYISSNCLKKYIKDSDSIDFNKVWNDFTIHSAEIDSIEEKGKDINNVVVAKIVSLSKHPTNEKYNVAKLDVGFSEITVVSSATNLYEGMYVPCALEGGSLKGLEKVTKVELGGVLSEGVLASEKELGISDSHLGVMDLSKEYKVGENIKEYIPIDDIIIEIDNKSLTNRPDMWGHYGIAREVAAITGKELMPLDIFDDITNTTPLNIKVEDKENCNRYSGLKISNITKKEATLDMKVMLYYCGMRSISLLVDLTNYLMLELAQPMHAFDSSKIDNIIVKNVGKEKIKFTTLDGIERDIPENTLMICNEKQPVAIAGIMGGLNSEIDDDTTSLILESANFDAACVRKSAVALGLRTEASARYEKSLDPNMTVLAIKRFVKLLTDVDKEISIDSRIEDIYVNEVKESVVNLKKDYLRKYMGFVLDDEVVTKILKSLHFKVEVKEDCYVVTAPTYRSTKDIKYSADIIEEIARIYGYNNLEEIPLKLDLTAQNGDNKYDLEYDIKKTVALNTGFSEIHTYLWYQTDMLNKFGINKDENIKLVNKKDNSIIRDDVSLSLFEQCIKNSKYYSEYGIFEIGSAITKEKEERILSILSVCLKNDLKDKYMQLKKLANMLIRSRKNVDVKFEKENIDRKYLNNEYSLVIKAGGEKVGYISVFDRTFAKECGKKTEIVNVEINIEKLLKLAKHEIEYVEPSKYPTTTIDYTVIMEKDDLYDNLENVLKKYFNKYLISYNLHDLYIDDKKKVTVRFVIGAMDKTLTHEEIQKVSEEILSNLEKNNYNIVK